MIVVVLFPGLCLLVQAADDVDLSARFVVLHRWGQLCFCSSAHRLYDSCYRLLHPLLRRD